MSDLNDKINERWQHRRKKGHNWPKLIVMVLLLAALLYIMGILQNSGNVTSVPMAETADSTTIVIPETEQNP
ncbi:MAG: hypothetical protein LRZ88_13770 [Candidatus Cloacimonetes bacterium]|nr:hypothetical protein [Candidatus Cloacimonadota bacterium]